MKISFLLLCSLHFSMLFAQQNKNDTIKQAYVGITSYEIPLSSIQKKSMPDISEFQGAYHFGESEGESTLTIIISNGKLFANESSYIWEDSNKGWQLQNERITLNYKNGQLETDDSIYDLYVCINEETLELKPGEKGLVSEFFEKENGRVYHYYQFNAGVPVKNSGKYPETSLVKLTIKDLNNYSKKELKIMRNEIFARNGYQFIKGSKMDDYFSKQEWYKENANNQVLLSLIEEYNIDLIKLKENE